jgi:hypothetical protein
MWYKPSEYACSFQLKLNSKIHSEFIAFCNEEIFYSSEKDTVDVLNHKFNKNIFASFKFEEIDEYFLLFVLNYFQEKKLEFNDQNLMEFFANPASSPNHVLLIATSHSYATVKKASQFLDLSHPTSKHLWKEYLADYQVLFSDRYFTSPEFNLLLESKKTMVRSYLLGLEKIKSEIQDSTSEFTIGLPALLRTDLIIKKPIKYKALIEHLFDEGLVSPVMPLQETLGHQTIFEYTALRCQNNTTWWIEKILIDYEHIFNFSEMIEYFESQIKQGFYLLDFKEQLHNYKEMIEFMKKIKMRKVLELSLSEKISPKDKPIKI